MADPSHAVPPPPPPPRAGVPRWLGWTAFVLVVGVAAVLARRTGNEEVDEPVVHVDDGGPVRDLRHVSGHPPAPVPPLAPVAGGGDPHAALADASGVQPAGTIGPADASGPAAATTRRLERTFTLEPDAQLQVDVELGEVRVVPATGPEARVIAHVEGTDAHLWSWQDVSATGDLVHVRLDGGEEEARRHRSAFSVVVEGLRVMRGSSTKVSVDVEVPAGVAAIVETGAGDVHARAIAGRLDVATGGGDVHAEDVAALRVETGAGDVHVAGASGDVDVETGAGDVTIRDAHGQVEVETGAGDIRVFGQAGRVELETGAGGVHVDVPVVTDRIQVDTGMGEIQLAVDGGGFRLEAESGVGRVSIADAGRTHRNRELSDRLVHEVGGGGPLVQLETGAGSIGVTVGAARLEEQ